MTRIQIYTTRWCGACDAAKALLKARGLGYDEISLDNVPAFRQTLFNRTGRSTVPQILLDDQPIGGYTDLRDLDRAGTLAELLAA